MRLFVPITPFQRSKGFTLVELLLACAMSAVLAGALYGVFSGALKLRDKGQEITEHDSTSTATVEILRRDLQGMMPPTGILAGPILGESSSSEPHSDSLSFFTTSGIVDDREPWGEIQQVNYRLDETTKNNSGKTLVRETTRNLLPTFAAIPEQQNLLDGVQSLQFQYYDPTTQSWVDTWDSTVTNTSPNAVKALIEFATPGGKLIAHRPIEVVCTMAQMSDATTTTTASSEDDE